MILSFLRIYDWRIFTIVWLRNSSYGGKYPVTWSPNIAVYCNQEGPWRLESVPMSARLLNTTSMVAFKDQVRYKTK